MSGFLRNIARRAAGLPGAAPVKANVSPEFPFTLMEASAAAPAQPINAPISTSAPPAVQRRAQAPAPPSPAAPPAAAPPAVPRASPPFVPQPTMAQPAPPNPIFVERPANPAPRLEAAPIAPAPQDAVVPAPSPVVIREQVVVESAKHTESPPAPAPVPVIAPAAIPEPPKPRIEPAAKVENTKHETVLKEIIERIYATEPAPLKSAASAEIREHAATQPRPVETPVPQANVAQARIESRSEALKSAAPEKRTVNVRIGTLELNLASPSPAISQAAEPEAAFDGFEYMRMYRI